ncbi:MAG TPA: 3-oxoadipate enol-lactonase [Anaerolineae bacterium]
MKFATIGGITLHYTVEGSKAGAPLVFLNSLGTDLRIWNELVPAFVDRLPIIRYDKRGHGLSDCPPGPYSIHDLADDLAGLLGYLQVREAILIGISVGGMVALDYAARNPEGVRTLVLCDTAAKIGTAAYWQERIGAVDVKGLAHMADVILPRWFAPEFSVQRTADYRGYFNMLTRTPAAGYVATCAAIRDADLSEAARRIKARTLVLCGAEDSATPPDLVRGLAEALPDGRFDLIEKAGHLPCVEQPEAMATRIDRFLQEV